MSIAIRFLEAAGGNAGLTAADYLRAVSLLQIDAPQKQALLDRDHHALAVLLDGRTKMCCYVVSPDSNEPEPVPVPDDNGDAPDQDRPEVE